MKVGKKDRESKDLNKKTLLKNIIDCIDTGDHRNAKKTKEKLLKAYQNSGEPCHYYTY